MFGGYFSQLLWVPCDKLEEVRDEQGWLEEKLRLLDFGILNGGQVLKAIESLNLAILDRFVHRLLKEVDFSSRVLSGLVELLDGFVELFSGIEFRFDGLVKLQFTKRYTLTKGVML